MKKPLALKVLSIIILILSGFRLLAGISYIIIVSEIGNDILYAILVENFVCGILMLIAGIKLLKGKKSGRVLFIVATILAPLAYMLFIRKLSRGWLMGLIIILLLYLYPTVKEYFRNI